MSNPKKIGTVNVGSPLVWMDLEMTGLDPKSAVIIEIAVRITDNQLKLIAEGPVLVIHQSNKILDAMDVWNTKHHGASGLIKKVKESKTTLEKAENEVLAFIKNHCKEKESPLCGNSIAQDRRFLHKYMPRLEAFLHYRNIDVSTLKELIARWYPENFNPPKKSGTHKASKDIEESIQELQFYKKQYFVI
jgi:oligoribonuclease